MYKHNAIIGHTHLSEPLLGEEEGGKFVNLKEGGEVSKTKRIPRERRLEIGLSSTIVES